MMTRLRHNLLTAWKYLLSFRKQNWELGDYPVVVRAQEVPPSGNGASPRERQYRWRAEILKWYLFGFGDTPDEALRELAANFSKAAAARQLKQTPLPRPGTTVPVEWASRERIDTHAELAEDFIRRVLELEWAWISDESSLWDFHQDETNMALQAKIQEVYGVDVSDIESGNVAEILSRIAES